MALRMGDIMVNIRAQDFASRTLRRVGGELAGMSRMQQQFARNQERIGNLGLEEKRLRTIAKQVQLQKQLTEATTRLNRVQQIATTRRDPLTGRFMSAGDVRAAQDGLLRMQGNVRSLNTALTENQNAVDRLPMRYQRLVNNVGELGERFRKVRVETRGLTRDQELLRKAIPLERMDNMGRALSGIGRTMQLFGAVGTVAFGAAARSAAQFSSEATNAATQMRDITVQTRAEGLAQIAERTDQLTNGLQKNGVEIQGVLDLMQRYPATADEMTAAAYDIFSSMQLQKNGITDVAAGMQLLETANKIAVAGHSDLATATNVMITTLNNFARQGEDTTEVLDTMFDIVRFGRMRLADFDQMMNKIAPAAAGAGQSLEDVGGAMAFLTEVMPSQRMVATGISRLIEAFERPEIVKGLKNAGVEARRADGKLRPLPELLREINEELDPKNAADFFRLISASGRGGGRGVIFTQEGRRAFNQIMNNFDGYLERQRQIEQNTGEFGTSLEANLKSIGTQWEIFTNQLRVLVLVIGKEVVPVFSEVGDWIQQFVGWFMELDPAIRSQIVRWAAFGAIITLLAGVAAALAGSLITLAARLKLLTLTGIPLQATLASVLAVASRLAAFGAIAIILKVLWQGEASAIDFLLGAAFGAAAGSIFGPGGAILGAITVPVILSLIQENNKSGFERAFDQYQDQFVTGWKRTLKNIAEGPGGIFRGLQPIQPEFDKTEFERQWKILEKAAWSRRQKLPKMLPTQAELRSVTVEVRKLFREFAPTPKKAGDGVEDFFKRMHKQIKNGSKDQNEYLKQLEKWYDLQLEGTDSVIDRQKQLADVAKQTSEQTVDSMRQMFMQIRSLNEQAMGEIFQGPWLTSETFDLAKEWGIEPRINDMIRDLHEQNAAFARWRSNLDKLFAKGVPTEFIRELQQMGPEEGGAFVEAMLSAKPGQVQKVINEWKIRNKQIQDATKMDFTREIQAFRNAGVKMGEAIIGGFQDAQVAAWFDTWVTQKFPDVISSAVTAATNEWKQANPVPTQNGRNGTPPPPSRSNTNTNTNTNTKIDKSQKVEVKVEIPEPHDNHHVRTAAFVIANKTAGALNRKR